MADLTDDQKKALDDMMKKGMSGDSMKADDFKRMMDGKM